jgi:hydrogenase nickel incorporation protein HypA/HybF
MHELSVAQNIIEIVELNVPHDELCNVRQVALKVGEFSGVVVDSLKFSYEIITGDTDLRNSELTAEVIPFSIKCADCGSITTNIYGLRECENCLSTDTEVLGGTELNISEIILKENT